MSAPDDESTPAEREARIAAAFETDPHLAEELALIGSQLSVDVRERFWLAFADELACHERPAAAVLNALTYTARG